MGVLTTVGRVKGALQIPGGLGTGITIHDVRIGELIEEAEASILGESTLDQIEPKTYRERLDVGGTGLVAKLNRFPVWSVAAITVTGGRGLVEGEDYLWEQSGRIRSLSATGFPRGIAQLDVTYVAGLVQVAGTTDAGLIKAATLWAARSFNQESMAGLGDVTVAPISKTIAGMSQDAAWREINRILSRYRKPH